MMEVVLPYGPLKHIRLISAVHFIIIYLQCCCYASPNTPYSGRLQEQDLEDKQGVKFQKCVLRNCSYRTTFTAFWDCVSESCSSNPSVKKRWIDNSFYYETRRSIERSEQVDKCIRVNCKNLGSRQIQSCLKVCNDLLGSQSSNKRSSEKFKWVDPTLYGKRKGHSGQAYNQLKHTDYDSFKKVPRSNKQKRFFYPFVRLGKRYYPFAHLGKRSQTDSFADYDDGMSPKRWLDPMTYKKDRSKMISPITEAAKRSTVTPTKAHRLCESPLCEDDIEDSEASYSFFDCFQTCTLSYPHNECLHECSA